jgi:hypothetical protein
MASSGMLRRVALVKPNVSEELSASFIRVTKIGELVTTLAVTSNGRTLRRNTKWYFVFNIMISLRAAKWQEVRRRNPPQSR